jgi:hypothetical protein
MGRRPIAGIAYISRPAALSFTCPFSIFHNPARSCADSDWCFGVNQGRGSPFGTPAVLASRYVADIGRPRAAFAAISEVLRDHTHHTARAHAATAAVPSDRLRFCMLHVPPRALWLECGPVEKKKTGCFP